MSLASPRSSGAVPAAGGASVEEQHQREMVRIHELWLQAKAELREKSQRLEELERSQTALGTQRQRDHEGALQQMNAVTVELRDKLRFTELQLAASREEGSQLAGSTEALRGMLADAQAQLVAQGEELQRQGPLVRELQADLQRAEREKQEHADLLYEEQQRAQAAHGCDTTSAR